MSESGNINRERQRQRESRESRVARQELEESQIARQQREESQIARQQREERIGFRQDQRNNAFRRDNREIGGPPRSIRVSPPSITQPGLNREIADDVANERQIIRAEYFAPGLSQAEYRRHGFEDLNNGDDVVANLNNANFIEHIKINGERELYKARNFTIDKYDPDNLLEARDITDEETVDPSDEIKLQLEAMARGGKYRFVYIKPPIDSRTGGAFMYFLKEAFPYSLDIYGIYKPSEWEQLSDIEFFNSCLVHCFKDHPKYERVLYSKASIHTLCCKKVFEIICDMIESNVIVHKIEVNNKRIKQNGENVSKIRKYKYVGKNGKKYDNDFDICLLQGHYFPYIEDTGFTTQYIKKCVWKDEEKDPQKLKTKYGLYETKTASLNSFNLIKLMLEQKEDYFEDFRSEILKEPRKEKIDEQIMFKDYEQFDVDFDSIEWEGFVEKPDEFDEILENEDDIDEEELFNNFIDNIEIIQNNIEEKNYYKEREIFHADIETRPNEERKHVPYCMCCDNNEGTDKQYFWGDDCVRKCLNYIVKKKNKKKKTIIKFQNLGFDINFIRNVLSQMHNTIEPSKSKVYRLNGAFKPDKGKTVRLTFIDQYPQIPMKLDDYADAFGREKGKTKGFRHDFYAQIKDFSKEYLTAPHSAYNELLKIFPKEYIRESTDGKMLILEYKKCAIDYCQQDVETQRQGWVKMHKQVMDELELDYNNYMTISNLSKAYCEKEGCYDGVYKLRGKTALFVRKSVVGGRTMVSLHNKENPGIRILNEREGDELQGGFDFDYENEEIKPEKNINIIFTKMVSLI